MYDIPHVLDVMGHPPIGATIFAAMSTVGNIVFFLEIMRLGFRHKAFSYTVGATFLGLSHDLNFVLEYDKWFHIYNDPSMKMWWFFLVFACVCEFVYFWQLVVYGNKELMPNVSRATFAALCLAGLAGVGASWLAVKQFLDDDIYMFAFGVTVFWQAPFSTALMLRRASRLGSSRIQWVSFLIMISGYFGLTIGYFGGPFAQMQWILLGLSTFLWGAFNLWLVGHLPDVAETPQSLARYVPGWGMWPLGVSSSRAARRADDADSISMQRAIDGGEAV